MFSEYRKLLIFVSGLFLVFLMYIVISCSGGGGGGGGLPPFPTFDTSTITFPTFSTSTTTFPTFSTSTTSSPTPTTTSNLYKFLDVKVLRIRNGNVEWLGSYEWNNYAYVHFSAKNYNNDKYVYVNDGWGGTSTRFNYDRYYVDYVDIGVYRYYYDYDYIVKIGDNYYSSSEAWYGRFYVDDYRPYGSSIYIVFKEGVTFNRLGQKIK
jgi:hypothetical protein